MKAPPFTKAKGKATDKEVADGGNKNLPPWLMPKKGKKVVGKKKATMKPARKKAIANIKRATRRG